jgi:pseudouridine kinase
VGAVESHLTPSLLAPKLHALLPTSCLLVLDCNLTEEALAAAARGAAAAGVPVLLEPVSVPKSARAAGSLRDITFITPNAGELIAIANEIRARRAQPPLQSQGASGVQLPVEGGAKELISKLAQHAAVLLQEGEELPACVHIACC